MESIRRFRIINKIEGYSYLILLFVAMPLKYLAGLPEATKVAGMVHGVLFILFCYQLYVIYRKRLVSRREATIYFILSLIPFGSFYTDRLLRAKIRPGSLRLR